MALGTHQEIIDTGIDFAKLLQEEEEEDSNDNKSEVSNTNESVQQQLSLRRSGSREVSTLV